MIETAPVIESFIPQPRISPGRARRSSHSLGRGPVRRHFRRAGGGRAYPRACGAGHVVGDLRGLRAVYRGTAFRQRRIRRGHRPGRLCGQPAPHALRPRRSPRTSSISARPGKAGLAYLLTDEAYAVIITHYNKPGNPFQKHWYFLGAGLTLWTSWQISTAVGILLGAGISRGLATELYAAADLHRARGPQS